MNLPSEVENKEKSSSAYMAQFFLIAIPLVVAPVAFYINSENTNNSSIGLEFLLIGVLVLEFGLLFITKNGIIPIPKSSMFDEEGIFEEKITILELLCPQCEKNFKIVKPENDVVKCHMCDFGPSIIDIN